MMKKSKNIRQFWIKEIQKFMPGFLMEHPILSEFKNKVSIIFHGSTMMGIDDKHSDLDFWLLLPAKEIPKLDLVSETRFFQFKLNEKLGHLNAESAKSFSNRFNHCDMDIIYQLRTSKIISDNTGIAKKLVQLAKRPMRKEVSNAFFFFHYVEMRGEHRACDNPMERGEPVGIILSLTKTLSHAMRAAIVLDRKPYPYDKWLYNAVAQTTTGKLIQPNIKRILKYLESGYLQFKGPEKSNPIGKQLMAIRGKLIEAAQAKGINTPWLTKWWLYMTQSRKAIADIKW